MTDGALNPGIRSSPLVALAYFVVGIVGLPVAFATLSVVAGLWYGEVEPGGLLIVLLASLLFSVFPTVGCAIALVFGPPVAPVGRYFLNGFMLVHGAIVTLCSVVLGAVVVDSGGNPVVILLLSPLLAAILTFATLLTLARGVRRARPAGCCTACGYPLVGYRSTVCPECGAYVSEPDALSP